MVDRSRLLQFARRRVASPPGPLLLDDAALVVKDPRLLEDPLVPWEMSVGAHAPVWRDLNDEQRLAANHLMYVVHYQRIMTAEVYSIVANTAMAAFFRPIAPEFADLLLRENAEEEDHIAAFTQVSQRVAAHHGYGDLPVAPKPLRRLIERPGFVRAVLRIFGTDYLVVHFLGRGHLNHMGRAFEEGIAAMDGPLHLITAHHIEDEAKHLAASCLVSAEAPTLQPDPVKQRLLYGALAAMMRNIARWAVFEERLTERQERAAYRRALSRSPAFRGQTERMGVLIDGHFGGLSGVQRAKNAYIGRPNQAMVERCALDESARRAWVRWMRRHQGRIAHYPDSYSGSAPRAQTADQ